MTRSIVSGLLGLISVVTMGVLPIACQSGGVGDPCIPEDEYSPEFAGFKVTEENIESRSFQCQTRICLVNHFQGRVSCPRGQPTPAACDKVGDDAKCVVALNDPKATCVEAATLSPDCDPTLPDKGAAQCNGYGGVCDATLKACTCTGICPAGWFCDASGSSGDPNAPRLCKSYVCHTASSCQRADSTDAENKDKACCVPGTDTPISQSVCGQCDDTSNRDAKNAVYCSCRCGVADGEKPDADFNFCECPNGFECTEIRKNVGLGDKQITGKYCIKQGSAFKSEQDCGQVGGYYNSGQCKGIGTGL